MGGWDAKSVWTSIIKPVLHEAVVFVAVIGCVMFLVYQIGCADRIPVAGF